jgi:hypothetical protein
MKIALISFHKNVSRYPKEWIDLYKESILNQTYNEFDIIELNYGGGDERIFENSEFISIELKDHAEAHNFLLHHCFKNGYDVILNTNVDDYYPLDRVEKQINTFDPDVAVSSGNYSSFSENNSPNIPTEFHKMIIHNEFRMNHNIIAHPSCCYSKKIMEYKDSLISEEIPADDFALWRRLLDKGAKFKILPDVLMYYRISDLKTGK